MAEPARRPLPIAPPSAAAVAQPRVVAEPRNLTVETYRALADPLRLQLIALIAARGPICVCHLEEELPYSQPRISKHLATLRRSGLVSTHRDGNWVYYSIDLDGLGVAREFINELEQSIRTPHAADSC